MPALKKTNITGQVVWLGTVADRDAELASKPRQMLDMTFAGPSDEDHAGLTRLSCSRVTSQYPKGTEIRNTRQLAVVSAEELRAIADEMEIETLDPAWVGATLVVEGISDFSHIPPSSRLQSQSGATITIDMLNRPCVLPHPVIDEAYPGKGNRFKAAAKGRRGVTAWVQREGRISLGDTLTLHIPDQRPWQPA